MKRPKSKIKGVTWCARHQKWVAQLQHKDKHYFGGYHTSIVDATLARQKLLKDHGPVKEPYVLKIKKNPKKSVCRVMRCTSKCEGRGLCKFHYRRCSYHGLLDVYGVPAYRGKVVREYKINKKAGPYVCRMTIDGENCLNKIYIRGLCHKHYNKYHRDGKLNKFALPRYANPKRAIGVRDYDYDNN